MTTAIAPIICPRALIASQFISLGRWRLGVEISARQMGRFPIHSHLDPGPAAWMIKENKFFERRRIELAIRAELERDARFAVGLARSVDPELVRFAFGGAHNRIEN